jgi:peptide/nickel transport system ATP-binding protein
MSTLGDKASAASSVRQTADAPLAIDELSEAPLTDGPLLDVRTLRAEFHTPDGVVRAVDGVSFQVEAGQTLGIVGESGSGKSVTCLAIMGLLDRGTSTVSGQALFRGRDLLSAPPKVLRGIRGNRIAMISQDPMTSLNPVHRIGVQLVEAVRLHGDASKREARARAVEALKAVGIPDAQTRIDDYPHQFSGGMRQRIMIATALINSPDLIIADEPTTALDVTTQAQILSLLRRLQREYGTAIILITHDLGVVAEAAHDVAVMYAARIVERGTVASIFNEPRHPYTWGLMGSLPRLNETVDRLTQIRGQPPSLLTPPEGCRFHPRCRFVMSVCSELEPPLADAPGAAGHQDACHLDEPARQDAVQTLVGRTRHRVAE